MFRFSRIACGLCCLVMMALSTSALVWLGDRLLAQASGEAWGLFDETRLGLSREIVDALWAQGAGLWLLTSVVYPFLHVSLAIELRRGPAPDYATSLRQAFFVTVVPGLSSLGAARLYADVGDALVHAGSRARGERVRKLGAWGLFSFLLGGLGAFVTIFATALPLAIAKPILLVGFTLPFLLPPLARVWLFTTLYLALRELDLKRTAREVRAGFSASVAG